MSEARHIVIEITDESVVPIDTTALTPVERFPFTVINPIFKNGRTYQPGDTVLLTHSTADAFIANGDVQETTHED